MCSLICQAYLATAFSASLNLVKYLQCLHLYLFTSLDLPVAESTLGVLENVSGLVLNSDGNLIFKSMWNQNVVLFYQFRARILCCCFANSTSAVCNSLSCKKNNFFFPKKEAKFRFLCDKKITTARLQFFKELKGSSRINSWVGIFLELSCFLSRDKRLLKAIRCDPCSRIM